MIRKVFMDLKLKNIIINKDFSEETTMFHADLYIGRRKVAHCKNDGHGGSTYYDCYPGQNNLLTQAEYYCNTLPNIKYEKFNISITSNLENWVDRQIDSHIKQKK